ncbi:MAG: hypothetical protein Q4G44_07335 [Alcaligenaceae bacterium]|nr:hypothetical protein [Alcaligenaceae bacterium]
MKINILIGLSVFTLMTGCASYSGQPYTTLADNQVAIRDAAKSVNAEKVVLETVTLAESVSPTLTCRAAGPVHPAPGKTVQQYIEEALKSELYAGGVYAPDATNRIKAEVNTLGFSSMGDAHWALGLHLKSSAMPSGYSVEIKYPFSSSYFADYACRDVAGAFAPAVQQLVKKVVTAPEFQTLIGPASLIIK